MGSSNNLLQIDKLKGISDYNEWKFAMKAYLEDEDLWKCVEGEEQAITNERNMAKANAKIILAVDKTNYTHIRDATTPKQMWESLEAVFQDSGLTRKVGHLRSLVTTQLENWTRMDWCLVTCRSS